VRHGAPARVLRAAIAALGAEMLAASPIIATAPLGPARRRFANAAVLVRTGRAPDRMLEQAKRLEDAFGRRRSGRRWGDRVLDCDIVLWSGGAWSSPGLTIPHPRFRTRDFVLRPAAAIAPDWRDPLTGLTVRQLHARLLRRLTRSSPLPIARMPGRGP
jgi:2-amino-4-hydroxy-6-hydroxymethyldihydropteridine diphosphokinase